MIPMHLDSIAIRLRQDLSWLIIRFNRILPLNAERPPRKKPRQYSSIRVNWSQIFTEIGLVVWIDHLSCGNLYLD